MEYVLSFIILIFILFMAYYSTKFLGVRFSNISNGKYMKVVERMYIDQGKTLQIIKIHDKYHVIATSQHSVTDLGVIENFVENVPVNENVSFQNILKNYTRSRGKSDE